MKKRQSIDTNTKMTEMLYLPHKDFKAAMIKAIRNTFKTNEEYRKP